MPDKSAPYKGLEATHFAGPPRGGPDYPCDERTFLAYIRTALTLFVAAYPLCISQTSLFIYR